jgi:PKD repeat protein
LSFPFSKSSLPVIVFFSCWLFNCNKAKQTGPRYTVSHAGNPYVGDTIAFNSTAPSTSTFFWNFGDSSTSSVSNPYHVYSKPGTYIVLLVVNNDTITSLRDTIMVGPQFGSSLLGTRIWHSISYIGLPWPPWDTTLAQPDVSLAVSFINALAVSIGTDTLQFDSKSSSDSVLTYRNNYFYPPHHSNLYFYHYSGIAQYYKVTHASAAAGDDTNYYYTP